MQSLKSLFIRLAREEDGAAATEYAILVALIAAALVIAISNFDIQGLYKTVNSKLAAIIG